MMKQTLKTFEDFAETVRAVFAAKYPEKDVLLPEGLGDVMTIGPKGGDGFQGVHLAPFWELYQRGAQVYEICEAMDQRYQEVKDSMTQKQVLAAVGDIANFEEMKGKLRMSLACPALTRGMERRPIRKWQDLAASYVIPLPWDGDRGGAILVTDQIREMWNVTEADLYAAVLNSARQEADIILRPLEDLMEGKEQTREEFCCSPYGTCQAGEKDCIYLLASKTRAHGAAGVLYQGLLKAFAEQVKEDVLYLLPATVHEWLLFPEGAFPVREVLRLFRECHPDCEDPCLRVPDHIYRYDAASDTIAHIYAV